MVKNFSVTLCNHTQAACAAGHKVKLKVAKKGFYFSFLSSFGLEK
jgi:hypothetical protein